MVNIFISVVVTVYIVVYPAEWIIELMEVRCVSLRWVFVFECCYFTPQIFFSMVPTAA